MHVGVYVARVVHMLRYDIDAWPKDVSEGRNLRLGSWLHSGIQKFWRSRWRSSYGVTASRGGYTQVCLQIRDTCTPTTLINTRIIEACMVGITSGMYGDVWITGFEFCVSCTCLNLRNTALSISCDVDDVQWHARIYLPIDICAHPILAWLKRLGNANAFTPLFWEEELHPGRDTFSLEVRSAFGQWFHSGRMLDPCRAAQYILQRPTYSGSHG